VTLQVKKDGSRWLCGDYRPLNAQTQRDSFTMPLIDDVLDQLGKFTWFIALDLQFRFWQIPMALEDIKKTTIITKSGLYKWNVMPFGLKNAIITFPRTMAEIFKDWRNKSLKVFVDDVNIHNMNWRDHLQHIWTVFHHLKEVHLKLNPIKRCFGVQNITFLGHMVNVEGFHLDPKKIVMEIFPVPKAITNVRAFLGLIGYYCKFILGYAKIVEPLFGLTTKECKFVWTPIYQGAL
jgi:hypothetical protein